MTQQTWQSIPQIIDDAATRFPTTEAIVDGENRITFPDAVDRIRRSARALMATGIQPGDRVAVWAPNISDWICAALSVHYAGGTLITINTRFKADEARYLLQKSQARVLFTVSDFLDNNYVEMLGDRADLTDLDEVVVLRGQAKSDGSMHPTISYESFLTRATKITSAQLAERSGAVSGEDVCHILFTSGTTGTPKGVRLQHGSVCRAYEVLGNELGYEHGDRALIVLPFFHSFGLHQGILASFMFGMTLLPHLVFDTETVMRRLADEKVTVFPGPPTVFQEMIQSPLRSELDLSALNKVSIGAAGFLPTLVPDIKSRLGADQVFTGYGLTEATGIVTITAQHETDEQITETDGKPLPGVEVRIIDETGKDLPANEQGEVLARGFNIMLSYLDDQAATDEAIDSEGWLHTGDIGYFRDDGYLVITDRLKDMFMVGGFNAYPAEIEASLDHYPGVAQVAVIGVPDKRLDEVGMAFIIAEPDKTVDPEELLVWAKAKMANYKVPRYVEIVETFPLNATGKVLKGDLRSLAATILK